MQQSSTISTSQEKNGEFSKKNPSLVQTLSRKISNGFQRLSKQSSKIMPYDRVKEKVAQVKPNNDNKESFDISPFNNENSNSKSSSSHSSEVEEEEKSSNESSESISGT